MITDLKPLELAEVKKYVKDSEDNKEILSYLKKFAKSKPENSKKIKQELEKLNLMKLNQESIVKIIDFLPEDSQDINKILFEVSLDESEINSILDIVKKYKK